MKTRQYFVVSIIVLVIHLPATLAFCDDSAKLWITEGFNGFTVLEENLQIKKRNVMEILAASADLETAYAGGFVNSINGIRCYETGLNKKDWFYYINGIMAHLGALQYFPKDGDIIWWDYHQWSDDVYIRAVIGAYPQPFLNGYDNRISPTAICATDGLKEKAGLLKENMIKQGIKKVSLEGLAEKSVFDYTKNIYLIIGPWPELQRNFFLKGIYDNYRKTGFLVRFEADGIHAFNIKEEAIHVCREGSVIVAAKIGFGRDNPMWLITGTSNDAVKTACDLLIDRPGDIKFYSAAIISGRDIINVPIQKE